MSIDNRKHPRLAREEKIFIEVLSASNCDSDDNILLECSTCDISVSGMKICSNYPFIVNSVLELLINFEKADDKFLLTGEVKWFEEMGDGRFLAGFELIDAEHSDYFFWQNMFEDAES